MARVPSIPVILAVAAVGWALPAAAVTPLDRAGSMAAAAGEVIGGAAGCGVAESRLIAVSAAAIQLIRLSGASEQSLGRARSIYESFAGKAEAATRADPSLCPDAVRVFEQAERNRP